MMTVAQAEKELEEAAAMTPGQWVPHSRSAGLNARLIAEKCGMDGDRAYIFGLLHDIGRRKGSWDIVHIFDGYDYMVEKDEHEVARICLTHSFPAKNYAGTYIANASCTDEQKRFIREYIDGIEFDDYDLLIQLCDSISLPSGACIMEKRLVDVVLRHGIREYSVERWRKFIDIKKYFDARCGCNIYTLLPNVYENSIVSL